MQRQPRAMWIKIIHNTLFFAGSLVVMIGVAFRFLWLETIPGINGDEAWMGWKVARVWAGEGMDWYAYSGNFSNPFFLIPLLLTHGFVEPGGFALRIVAAVSGVLLLALNFVAARRIIGFSFACASTLLLAVLPMNIAHSRFGWEPSQIPLFSLFYLVSALFLSDSQRNPWLWTAVAGFLAYIGFLVHPTMIFLLPIVGLGFLSRWLLPESSFLRFLTWLFLGILGTAILGILAWYKSPPWIQPEITRRVVEWAWMADDWNFTLAWGRLFNGLNTFAFLSGSWLEAIQVLHSSSCTPEIFWIDWVTLGLFAAAGAVLLFSFLAKTKFLFLLDAKLSPIEFRTGLILGFGFFLPTLLFWVMNGSGKVAVYFDRYGLWALLPGAWFLCWAYGIFRKWLKKKSPMPLFQIADVCGIILAGLLLSGFWFWYFLPFLQSGGEAHISSRTAMGSEPKLAAGDFLKKKWNDFPEQEKTLLVSSDWFAFWPVLYRMQGNRREAVAHLRVLNDPQGLPILPDDFSSQIAGNRLFLVEYANGMPWKTWDEIFKNREVIGEWMFYDQSGRDVLLIREYSGCVNLFL